MNRNEGGTPPGELARVSAANESVINPGDYWTRSSDQPSNYQFTGDNTGDKKVVAATTTKPDAPGTVTAREKDSLWTIASKLVNESSHKDKSDKFKLDVVKGLVEKNKDTIKGLEANPDKIKGGQVFKVDSVEELAKLGHGKVLNTKYKPPSEREPAGENSPNLPKTQEQLQQPQERHHRHHGQRHGGLDDQRFGDHNQMGKRPMDLGPMKDIMGMIGMFAGGALMGNRFGRDHHHGPRGYYDDNRQGYYDGNYGRFGHHNQHRHPNYNDYRQQQFRGYEPPVSYSHYIHPQQNIGLPMHQSQHQQHRFHHQQQQQQLLRQQQIQQWQQRNPTRYG